MGDARRGGFAVLNHGASKEHAMAAGCAMGAPPNLIISFGLIARSCCQCCSAPNHSAGRLGCGRSTKRELKHGVRARRHAICIRRSLKPARRRRKPRWEREQGMEGDVTDLWPPQHVHMLHQEHPMRSPTLGAGP
eukprot:scaffold84696_cov30-Tisochrysis_lutea.AAC.2